MWRQSGKHRCNGGEIWRGVAALAAAAVAPVAGGVYTYTYTLGTGPERYRDIQQNCQRQSDNQCVDSHPFSPYAAIPLGRATSPFRV